MSLSHSIVRSLPAAAGSCSRRSVMLAAKPVARLSLSTRSSTVPQPLLRSFSNTVRATNASNNNSNGPSEADISKIAESLPGIDKIRNSPKAKQAMEHLMQTLEKNGIDLSSGQRPGMLQMAKIAMSTEVRTAAQSAIEALKEVGVDISPQHLASIMSGGNQQGKEQDGKDAKKNDN